MEQDLGSNVMAGTHAGGWEQGDKQGLVRATVEPSFGRRGRGSARSTFGRL